MAARIVFWSSARRRYGIIAHRGQGDRAGHARMTGRQKSMAAPKKQRCSTWCHESEARATSYTAGRCQIQKAAANAIQLVVGWVRKLRSRLTGAAARTA